MAGATYICGPCPGGWHGLVSWKEGLDAEGFRHYTCHDCGETWKTKEEQS